MKKAKTDSLETMMHDLRTGSVYWEERAIVDFTEAVVARLKELGLTKCELAARLDSKPPYINKLLSGENNFTLKTMVKVARALRTELRLHLGPEPASAPRIQNRWEAYIATNAPRLVAVSHSATDTAAQRESRSATPGFPAFGNTVGAGRITDMDMGSFQRCGPTQAFKLTHLPHGTC